MTKCSIAGCEAREPLMPRMVLRVHLPGIGATEIESPICALHRSVFGGDVRPGEVSMLGVGYDPRDG